MRCLTLAMLGLAVLLGTAFQPVQAKRSEAAPSRRAEIAAPLRGGHAARPTTGHAARHATGAARTSPARTSAARTSAARPAGRAGVQGRASVAGRASLHGRASVSGRGYADRRDVRRPMQGTRAVHGRYAMAREHHAALGSAACRRGGRHCGGAIRTSSWSAGLTPAANIQANECPDGTMATLARGHDNIVRCMPL